MIQRIRAELPRVRSGMTRRTFLAAGVLVLTGVASDGSPGAGSPRHDPAAGRRLVYGQHGWGRGAW
ncbi:MAG TPA: hypothetical protein VLW53_03900 [Candidatus Eisenbacteria bacterium]|nr:hypothetical protein [Candidatus Eisenbacteria bacterium]